MELGTKSMEQKKVYELAKELGIDSISLVDRLRSIDIDVRNHMTELSPEEVAKARDSLAPKSEAVPKTSKAKRSTTPRGTSTKKSAATSTESASGASSTIVRKRATAKSASKTDPASETAGKEIASKSSPSKSPVKKSSKSTEAPLSTQATETQQTVESSATGETETSANATVKRSAKKLQITEHSKDSLRGMTVVSTPASEAAARAAALELAAQELAAKQAAEEASLPPPATTTELPLTPDAEVPGFTASDTVLPDGSTTSLPQPDKSAPKTLLRKSFLRTVDATAPQGLGSRVVSVPETQKSSSTGPASSIEPPTTSSTTSGPITPAASRIIPSADPAASGPRIRITANPADGGRSVLTIVKPASPIKTLKVVEIPQNQPRTGGGPTPGRFGTGFAPAGSRFTPTPLGSSRGRAGPTPLLDLPNKDAHRIARNVRDSSYVLTEEENKRKGLGAKEELVKPEDVKFADYRKKEMVFLPKRKKAPIGRSMHKTQITTPAAHKRVVEMEGAIRVQDLANQMGLKAIDVVRKLMGMGQMVSANQAVDFDTASLIGTEFGYEIKSVAFDESNVLGLREDSDDQLFPRPPVVTIMGHVDHGKTTLLDAVRSANVASGEAGGITQHIGAYTVAMNDNLITFIDTPGHEAFTAMRARGANVTDIVVLVVAADDGVMPQTREAISHAKAAEVPIIVAVNKMDKPGAQPDRVKQALSELDLLAEDWGGQTIFVPVSALKREGLDKLLESILLVAEVQELKSNPEALAHGTVLESRLDRGRGPVATLLVQRGTLRVGDIVTSGTQKGRIKAMIDHHGASVKEVKPGMAAEILGFEATPNAGESFDCVSTDSDAETLIDHRTQQINLEKAAKSSQKMSLEQLFAKAQAGQARELKVLVKADVFGSAEAVKESLQKLITEKIKVSVILAATGGITESDVLLASASNAIIIGFNVRPETKARRIAEAEHIEIKTYEIIYKLIEDVKLAMAGMLDKKEVEAYLGRAEVRQTFSVPKLGTVAGCGVIDGKIIRSAQVRLLRDNKVIYTGKLATLRRFKDDAKEVAQGYECGMGIENYNDIKIGDVIEAFEIQLHEQDLGL